MSKNIKILHLETSTEVCSVAISVDGKLIAEQNIDNGFAHSESGTLMVQQCLKEAGIQISALDAVSVSEGPGSYTGLRVGFAMAKGFCFAHNLKLITIPTLLALVHGLDLKEDDATITAMLDARRMEVYTESYDYNYKVVSPLTALILDAESYQKQFAGNTRNVFIGNGAHKVEKWLREGKDQIISAQCRAADQISIAHSRYLNNEISDTAYSVPQYLKPPNITVSKKNLLP